MNKLLAAARDVGERRARQLPAARRLRFSLALGSLERFADGRPIRMLDAGCGEGLFSELVARRHPRWEIVGVDADRELLQRARRSAEREGVSTRFEHRDLTVDLGDAVYDAVVALECLEEIQHDDDALARMVAALRPGGLLLVHVPERRWEPVFSGSEHVWRHEVRHGYALPELRQKLERAGAEVVSVVGTSRGTVRVAQEIRDRIKTSRLSLRLLALPLAAAAVRLERWNVTWGPPRALFAEAHRP
jgi:cyclopropane fatty-acyl-phospholipid synthase-like methyltransferase